MTLRVNASEDNRYRTQAFSRDGSENFVVAEKTARGVLLTEFTSFGEVFNQEYHRTSDALASLRLYMQKVGELDVQKGGYEKVRARATCKNCGKGEIVRDLDLVPVNLLSSIPVVPIFVCVGCKSKYYSVTDSYMRRLVQSNLDKFEGEELKERDKNEEEFISTLQEYVIRIFASKRISRIVVKR